MFIFMLKGRVIRLIIPVFSLYFYVSLSLNAQTVSTSVSWSSAGTGVYGASPYIYSIAVNQNGIVYAGGSFTKLGDRTTDAGRIAKWDPAAGIWTTLSGTSNSGLGSVVYSVALNGSDVYAAGVFSTLKNGATANRIAKWNSETGIWSNLGGTADGTNGTIRALAVSGSYIYAGGDFSACGNSISAYAIARWNTLSCTWSGLPCGEENGLDGNVLALAAAGDYIYAGGRFTHLKDGTPVNHIARFNTLTGTWSSLPGTSFNGVDGNVYAIAVSGNEVYVGGDFDRLGDGITSALKIAKWNSTSNTWSPLSCGSSNGLNSTVYSLASYGNDIYIAGEFTQLSSGTAVNRIVKWNKGSSQWVLISDAGSIGVNGTVNALAVNPVEGKLYAGGMFTSVGGGISAAGIASLRDEGNPLPVEFGSFSAELCSSGILLKWQTITETGNYGFEIERAAAERSGNLIPDFGKIGFVKGHGNSYKPQDYYFTDMSISGTGKYIYRLKQIDNEGGIKYSGEFEISAAWNGFELYSNYPNPFNPATQIGYQLDAAGFVSIKVYYSTGELVRTLVNEYKPAGRYTSEFDASLLPSGIYYYILQAENKAAIKKMMHLK